MNKASNFKLTKHSKISEIQADYFEFTHAQTGARHIHLKTDDSENCFAVLLKTPPHDSTGAPHILEHIALSGSQKYPIHEVFFGMVKRSLNTFMNAFTSVDWTAYPFATKNKTDFYNLISVYMDAVFYPKIAYENFLQEAWRLEYQNNKLHYKGVVYNEMKGALSTPDRLMGELMQQSLFKKSPYRHISGGDPPEIVKLTHHQLQQFHAKYYHPSNAYFFTYGNLPFEKHQEKIHEVIKNFTKSDADYTIPHEPLSRQLPADFAYTYPASKNSVKDKTHCLMAWITAPITDRETVLGLEILKDILIGSNSGPLKRALLESGLGEGLSDASDYHSEFKDTIFACGLKNIAKSDAKKAQKLILETLQKIVSDGISEKLIASSLHQFKIARLKIKRDHYPYGVELWFKFLSDWVHGGDALLALDSRQDLDNIAIKIKQGRYFESLIEKYLINNPRRAFIVLNPDPMKAKRDEENLLKQLTALENKLTEKQKIKIKQDAEMLRARQDERNFDCLPMLSATDIPQKARLIEPHFTHKKPSIKYYQTRTNNLDYAQIAITVPDMPRNRLQIVPLYAYLLPKIGTKNKSDIGLSGELNLYTGGITAEAHVMPFSNPLGRVFIDASGLEENREKMFGLLEEILNDADFNNQKTLKKLFLSYVADLDHRIIEEGHRYAMRLASSGLTPHHSLSEFWHGAHYRDYILSLKTGDFATLASDLQKIHRAFLNSTADFAFVGAHNKNFAPAESDIKNIAHAFNNTAKPLTSAPKLKTRDHVAIQSPVAYCACAFKSPRIGDNDAPYIFLASKILASNFLLPNIREKGGAYGAYAMHGFESGVFNMASFRDPHPEETLKIFDLALKWAREAKWEEKNLDEAKLQAISDIDRPTSPYNEAFENFEEALLGIIGAQKSAFRQAILNATNNDIKNAVEKHFPLTLQQCKTAVVG